MPLYSECTGDDIPGWASTCYSIPSALTVQRDGVAEWLGYTYLQVATSTLTVQSGLGHAKFKTARLKIAIFQNQNWKQKFSYCRVGFYWATQN